jgi:hypothetical protein
MTIICPAGNRKSRLAGLQYASVGEAFRRALWQYIRFLPGLRVP